MLTITYNHEILEFSQTQVKILKSLKNKSISRGVLSKETDIPKTTLSDNLVKLEKIGFLTKTEATYHFKRGRPKRFWKLTEEGQKIIEQLQEENISEDK